MSYPSENAFSIRRLNPFNGVLQLFTTAHARALSSNGLKWEIQVLSDRPQGLWANIPFAGQQFYTFGLWSQTEGFSQVPLNPLFNTSGMLDAAQQLREGLEPCLGQLPFPMADVYELWLLDKTDGKPVALLNSARSEAELEHREVSRWSAAEPDDSGFVSDTLRHKPLTLDNDDNPRRHTAILEALMQERSGHNQRRAWYLRDEKMAGAAVRDGEHDLPAELFPELPVSLDWQNAEDHQLIMDYILWKAPQMLLLPGISPTTREMLEKLAVKNPTLIDRFWRLIPEIHDKTLLNKARVEARIRLSNQN